MNMLIIGGTGSLGKTLIKHFLDDYRISVFSRDEAKHVIIKQMYPKVESIIGDIRDRDAVQTAIFRSNPGIIINAAALKNVPEVEDVPMEGIKTSLLGTENLIYAARFYAQVSKKRLKVLTVSTDKACKPVNSYGMAKALQERVHNRSNCNELVCNTVRYGNVLESRGSLIPLIKQRFVEDKKVFITHPDMTRFFLTLDHSVELIKRALLDNEGSKTFVPIIRSAKIVDIVEIYRSEYKKDLAQVEFSSIRPGEKIDEIMVSLEEASRAERDGNVFIIHDILDSQKFSDITTEYSSGAADILLDSKELPKFLKNHGVL